MIDYVLEAKRIVRIIDSFHSKPHSGMLPYDHTDVQMVKTISKLLISIAQECEKNKKTGLYRECSVCGTNSIFSQDGEISENTLHDSSPTV